MLGAFLACPLDAQKLSKKMLRSMRRQQKAEQAITGSLTQQTLPATIRLEETVAQTVTQASPTVSAPRFTSTNAQRAVTALFHQKSFRLTKDPTELLDELQIQQTNFDQPLFPLFLRHYYKQHFGAVSPNMDEFLNRLTLVSNSDVQQQITQRFHYLAQNKYVLGRTVVPSGTIHTLTQSSFRLRYTGDIEQLSAENLDLNKLILSVEQRMFPNPRNDFPIRHINGRTTLEIDSKTYPVFFYNGPLDSLGSFYRFLLNGAQHPDRHLTFVLDEEKRSMALFNHNRSLWLRISAHEFSSPNSLHVHLNELRSVTFTNKAGLHTQEQVNLNLSIPLATPRLSVQRPKDFLYRKMILEPAKIFQQDKHVTVERRPIW